jgi:DNA-binding MarR family transcriptional regulator
MMLLRLIRVIKRLNLDKLDLVVEQWKNEKPHLDTTSMSLIGRLLRISKHIETRITQCHKSFALTLGEFDVLAALRRSANNSCLTPSELSSALLLTSGAMTNRLDKLAEKGMINRCHSEEDRRSVTVALTDQGRELIDQAIEVHVTVLDELSAALSTDDKRLLNGGLNKWLTQFEVDL